MKTGFEGYSSAEIAVLNLIADLSRRYGLRPSDAEATLSMIDHPDFDCGVYQLNFEHRPDAPGTEKGDKFDRMMDALGFRDSGGMEAEHIGTIEDVIERAMSLAPRPRTVG